MKDERKDAAMATSATLLVDFSSRSQYIKTSQVRNPPTANAQFVEGLSREKN